MKLQNASWLLISLCSPPPAGLSLALDGFYRVESVCADPDEEVRIRVSRCAIRQSEPDSRGRDALKGLKISSVGSMSVMRLSLYLSHFSGCVESRWKM